MPPVLRALEPAARERSGAPVSADSAGAAIAADRPLDSSPAPGTAAAHGLRALDGDPVKVAIVGATGYVGAELVRLLARHPHATIVGLVGRERHGDPLAGIHPHLATEGLRVYDAVPENADAVFLALPHGAAAARIDEFLDAGQTVIDLGPDFRLRDPADYPRWYHADHPRPELLETAVYGLPELHRDELVAAGRSPNAIVGAPGCYATTTILALAPLARAGLIGDLVVDAKSGVSGAGRDPKPELQFGEVNESVKAYGIFTHRHIGEIEQELGALGGGLPANPGVTGVDFLPHLIPMTRGILSAGPRPDDPIGHAGGARRPVPRGLWRRAVRDGLRGRARDEARPRQQRGPRLVPPRRAQRPCARHRRARQPRQGGRRPGDPGLQRGPRPARDGGPDAAPARAMTLATDAALEALPATLPRVERGARIPAGFRAAGATAGIKASGRPDLVLIVADDGPVPAAAVFTPNRFAAAPVRLSRANLQATGGGAAAAGYARAVISTSGSANAATGPDGDADQVADRDGGRVRGRRARGPGAPPLDRDHRHPAAGRPGCGRHRQGRLRRPGGDRRGARAGRRGPAHHRHHGQGRDDDRDPAGGRRRHGRGDRDRHLQGRGDDASEHGHDAVDRPDGCDRGPRYAARAPARCRRPHVGPALRRRGHQHQRHRVRARLRPGRGRCGRRGHRRASGPGRRDRSGRTRPGAAAGGRRRGRQSPHHVPGDGGDRRRRRPGGGSRRDLVVARQGRGPRARPELGAHRRRGGERALRRRGRARGLGGAGRRGGEGSWHGGAARPVDAPDRDRGPPRLRRPGGWSGARRQGRRQRGDGRRRGPDPARPRARRGHRRGLRLRPDRGVRQGEHEYTT